MYADCTSSNRPFANRGGKPIVLLVVLHNELRPMRWIESPHFRGLSRVSELLAQILVVRIRAIDRNLLIVGVNVLLEGKRTSGRK